MRKGYKTHGFSIDDKEFKRIEERASKDGVSVSVLMKRALQLFLGNENER